MKILHFAIVALLACSFVSCKKKKTDEPVPETAGATVKFNHNWEGTPLALETEFVNSSTDDTLSFTTVKYYISNIKLKKADGSFYVQQNSYFLLNLSDPSSMTLDLGAVPLGDYTDLYFTFGVDSTRNVSGVQSGALSPSHGMFWSWSTGYIMSKMEGLSPNAANGNFAFHLGGFSGANSVVIEKHIDLTTEGSLSVTSGSAHQVVMNVNLQQMWQNSPTLSAVSDLQMPGAPAHTMAVDFLSGIVLDQIN